MLINSSYAIKMAKIRITPLKFWSITQPAEKMRHKKQKTKTKVIPFLIHHFLKELSMFFNENMIWALVFSNFENKPVFSMSVFTIDELLTESVSMVEYPVYLPFIFEVILQYLLPFQDNSMFGRIN